MSSRKPQIVGASAVAAVAIACAGLFAGARDAGADASSSARSASVLYGPIPQDQVEILSTPNRIKAAAASGAATNIWETLEKGEKVECLDCIPSVEPLLYDANPRTREIAAWWLRRRVFGVFGPGQVYERTVKTLQSDPDPKRRAHAAYALGEFLLAPGIDEVAATIQRDGDPTVRAAAASALGRLNDDGRGALSKALGDVDARVKTAALASAGRINTFTDLPAIGRLLGDGDPTVRRRAAELLGSRRAKDSVDGLMALAQSDADANVRNAACHALGALGDARARGVLEAIAKGDADGLVRDQAAIALRRL